ncbi:MAG: Crp/Fnr family transcriptional regulator [Anaerococcus hydrogenalis]|uniref:Crp/Fnr family transcriptional regulator n=1 Tax=Anaerococcus hydrogenalis TaxID=33029 RepID=UPI0028FEE927|nr:Crp/Fnr family transcriptional regulator [Anaerococcus hydrogenalis]MDU2582871.1 Crp/Fnr family transcriptional regulator [Anaerococcus hydrogenalis]MDU3688247.1 Crp/Fnr family transcriptional regulator [Anaerococcus hydrogenalis]
MNLRQIPLFKNLTEKDLKILEENIKIEEKTYEKGSYIFNQGDIKGDLYFLIEGSILVAKFDSNGKRSIIQTFNNKGIFGEVYAYLNEPFDFSALVQKKSKILIIKEFRNLINEFMPKSFLINYINLISKKCLVLSQKNQITNQFTLRQKIANFLLIEEKNNKIELKQTREELADFLSTTRPSLSRELSNMADENIIKISGKDIYILDINLLKNLL